MKKLIYIALLPDVLAQLEYGKDLPDISIFNGKNTWIYIKQA